MKFSEDDNKKLELTFNDVFIFQQYFEGGSRGKCNVKTDFLNTNIPIISANMNAVTGKRMCETLARYGGMGVLPQDMSFETMKRIVNSVKSADIFYDTPLTIKNNSNILEAKSLLYKRSHGLLIVVNDEMEILGVLTEKDLKDKDPFCLINDINYLKINFLENVIKEKDLKETVKTKGIEKVFSFLEEKGNNYLLITDDNSKKIKGIITKMDLLRNDIYSPTLDKNGKLDLAIAIGINQINKEKEKEIQTFIDLGISTFVVDTAHGYQKKMIDSLKALRKTFKNEIRIIAGNVCTKEGTKALIEAGADGVKVGIGPGAMCTTRMATGVGRPQFTAVLECSKEAKNLGGFVWADGGIKYPRDLSLAIAAGASHIMLGTVLAGTYESVGEIKFDGDKKYKENFGMASGKAVSNRNKTLSTFEKLKRNFYKEGISTSKIYLREGLDTVGKVVDTFISGLRSSMAYVGSKTIKDFQEKVIIGVQTSSGYNEGTPHGKEVK